jgi:hypothetical protein
VDYTPSQFVYDEEVKYFQSADMAKAWSWLRE